MKRVISLILTLTMVLGLTACGGDPAGSSSSSAKTEGERKPLAAFLEPQNGFLPAGPAQPLPPGRTPAESL